MQFYIWGTLGLACIVLALFCAILVTWWEDGWEILFKLSMSSLFLSFILFMIQVVVLIILDSRG